MTCSVARRTWKYKGNLLEQQLNMDQIRKIKRSKGQKVKTGFEQLSMSTPDSGPSKAYALSLSAELQTIVEQSPVRKPLTPD